MLGTNVRPVSAVACSYGKVYRGMQHVALPAVLQGVVSRLDSVTYLTATVCTGQLLLHICMQLFPLPSGDVRIRTACYKLILLRLRSSMQQRCSNACQDAARFFLQNLPGTYEQRVVLKVGHTTACVAASEQADSNAGTAVINAVAHVVPAPGDYVAAFTYVFSKGVEHPLLIIRDAKGRPAAVGVKDVVGDTLKAFIIKRAAGERKGLVHGSVDIVIDSSRLLLPYAGIGLSPYASAATA